MQRCAKGHSYFLYLLYSFPPELPVNNVVEYVQGFTTSAIRNCKQTLAFKLSCVYFVVLAQISSLFCFQRCFEFHLCEFVGRSIWKEAEQNCWTIGCMVWRRKCRIQGNGKKSKGGWKCVERCIVQNCGRFGRNGQRFFTRFNSAKNFTKREMLLGNCSVKLIGISFFTRKRSSYEIFLVCKTLRCHHH